MTFIPYVLVCAAALLPQECDKHNALDVVVAEPAKNEVMCNFYGMAALAGTSIGRDMRGAFPKVVCERSEQSEGVLGR